MPMLFLSHLKDFWVLAEMSSTPVSKITKQVTGKMSFELREFHGEPALMTPAESLPTEGKLYPHLLLYDGDKTFLQDPFSLLVSFLLPPTLLLYFM